MPELPEVESLVAFLRDHATGHTVARADAASFSVLKTFDPPLTALTGQAITDVGRHGKFLDIVTGQGLHLIMHLARAGWLRWRDDLPTAPPKPGKSPLAFRLRLDNGSGFDLTEQGTHKRLAVYLVRDPDEVPGVATLGPDPLAADFTTDTLASLLAGRPDPGQRRPTRPADHRRHRQRLLRRSAARGQDIAVQDRRQHDPGRRGHPVRRDQDHAGRSGRTFGWPGRGRPEGRRRAACGSTAGPARSALSAAIPSGKSRSPTRRCSTAPPARPAASLSPIAACPACSSNGGADGSGRLAPGTFPRAGELGADRHSRCPYSSSPGCALTVRTGYPGQRYSGL